MADNSRSVENNGEIRFFEGNERSTGRGLIVVKVKTLPLPELEEA